MKKNFTLFWGIFLFILLGIPIKAQRDVTNEVTFSNYLLVDIRNSSLDNSSYSGTGTNGRIGGAQYTFNYNISDLGNKNFKNGDFFTFSLTDSKYTVYSLTKSLVTSDGLVIGSIAVNPNTKTMKVTFNENIESNLINNLSGRLHIPVDVILDEGNNEFVYPDGTKTTILYTKKEETEPTPGEDNTYEEQIYKKNNSVYIDKDKTFIEWHIQINRAKKDFGDEEVILIDEVESNKSMVTMIPNSFKLYEATYSNKTSGSYSYSYGPKTYSVVYNEEEYHRKRKAGEFVAFVKLSNNGQKAEIYLGKMGDKQLYLIYETTHPQDGSKLTNTFSLTQDGKVAYPYKTFHNAPPKEPNSEVTYTAIGLPDYTDAIYYNKLRLTKVDSKDGTRLQGATFTITKNDDPSVIHTITTGADGKALSDVLPAGEYTLVETIAPAGYELDSTPRNITMVTNQITYANLSNTKIDNTPKRSFTAEKKWLGGTEAKPNITLILQRNGNDYLSATDVIKTLKNGETTATWDNLPVYNSDGVTKSIYTVREYAVENYKTRYEHTEDKTIITNIHKDYVETRNFTAEKVWVGGTDAKPEITLILQRNGVDFPIAGIKKLSNGQTTATWTNLLARNEQDDSPYIYSVREEAIAGYSTTYTPETADATTEKVIITNTAIAPAICTKPANTASGVGEPSKVGITSLGRTGNDNNDNWPMIRKGAWLVLESNSKPFVINRLSSTEINNISNPIEGMMVYDTNEKCLKIYNGNVWTCFSNPTCPKP